MRKLLFFRMLIVCSLVSLATTAVEARGKPTRPPQEPPPLTPAARAWHGFTSNGATSSDSSRLLLFGGAGADYRALDDLWYYRADTASWTFVTPAGKSRPGPRQWMGWSCGDGACVLANGSNGAGLVAETWVYAESTNAWTAVSCRRFTCPSARQMVTTAYDASSRVHMLFGGRSTNASLGDTWTFNAATRLWRSFGTQPSGPSARDRAAATYVPGIGVVMHGGQSNPSVRCDAFVWAGNAWTPFVHDGLPCLHSHSMAWDGKQQRLIVTGGYTDTSDTANPKAYYLQFENGLPAGRWSEDSDSTGCYAAVKPGARMALDRPTGQRVFVGGEENVSGPVVRYSDTSVCN